MAKASSSSSRQKEDKSSTQSTDRTSRHLNTITTTESTLLSSTYNPNPLLTLISLTRENVPEVVHKSIWSLYRVFVKFLADGKLTRVSMRSQTDEEEQGDGKENIVAEWVEERLKEYTEVLCGLIWDSESSLRTSATKILLNLLPPLSTTTTNPTISLPHLHRILNSLLTPNQSPRGGRTKKDGSTSIVAENQYISEDEEVLPNDVKEIVIKHLVDYDDLRWGFYKEISSIIESFTTTSTSVPPSLATTTLSLLLPLQNLPQKTEDINEFFIPTLSTPPSGFQPTKKLKTAEGEKKDKKKPGVADDWMAYYESSEDSSDEGTAGSAGGKGKKRKRVNRRGIHWSVWSVESHRKVFTSAWLGLLSLPLNDDQVRAILLILHSTIFPNLVRGRVVRITDWLGSVCDRGGPLALLSLNGLFMLIMQYNLEYPQFYRRLYGLMDRNVMHVKYRARFFRLSATFLSSPLLPATLIASFIKRLAQLALSSPPASIIMIIPFIYNLLKRHPSCMVLLQREDADFAPVNPSPFAVNAEPSRAYEDPYNPDEADPLKTKALDSCLWELKSLQRHYLSHVATMAKVFSEVFTKPEFVMEDFLDHGYASLFETEMKRKIKTDPALNIDEIKMPFPLSTASVSNGDIDEEEDHVQGDVISEMWTFGTVTAITAK